MRQGMMAGAGMIGVLAAVSVTLGHDHPHIEDDGSLFASTTTPASFTATNPGTRMNLRGDRITRIYGKSFSQGATPAASAAAFIDANASVYGVDPADLVPGGRFDDGRTEQPIVFDPESGSYKFTGLYYHQQVDGVPVYRGQLVLLVRNEPGNPLVLASSDLRHVDGFAGAQDAPILDAAIAEAIIGREFVAPADVTRAKLVVWAGVDDGEDAPRLAYNATARVVDPFGIDPTQMEEMVVDATTGEILHRENMIHEIDISGSVSGVANTDEGAFFCSPLAATPMPYIQVTAGIDSAFSDADGNFVIPHGGSSPVNVTATINGLYFDVTNFNGAESELTLNVTPPGPADFVFNTGEGEQTTAEVNAYIQANVVRDFTLSHNPAYPVVAGQTNFPVIVNRTGGICPGNAFYDPGIQTINFCLAGGSSPNTAYWKIVHHEYGHHLVNVGGSGQGAYGEGMSDAVSVVISDTPELALGFFGNCNTPLRNADNGIQYPCSGAIHTCGQLISGCVWDTRNELIVTEPDDYLDIIGSLTINSILLHTGSSIDPSITVDFLTLDDNDDDIFNGTPHYQEIAGGFGVHNMDAPALTFLDFEYPNGLPENIGTGGTVIRVEVSGVVDTPVEGTGMVHYDIGGGVVSMPMDIVGPNVYDATIPAGECGTIVSFSFSAEGTQGTVEDPPSGNFEAIVATDQIDIFVDDFETNQGWSVSSNVTDGAWNRGVPVGGGDRGDPPTDADRSGQCYLTDNVDGNSDVDDGTTTLTSPVLDAASIADGEPFIGYHRWYSNTFGNAPMADVFRVEVSDNGGANWTALETVGPAGPEVDGGWFRRDFRIADFVDVTSEFRIRFIASDLGAGSVVEAGVDGVELYGVVCDDEGVFGDLDGDGFVNAADLAILLANWGTDGDGDLNEDGIVDAADLAALLSAWTG